MKPGDISYGPTQEDIICCQKHLRSAMLGACQVKCVERAEPLSFHLPGSVGDLPVRMNYFVCEEEQGLSIPSPLRIWVAAHLDIQNGAAHPRSLPGANHCQNAFYSLNLSADTGLALVIGKATEATSIQINSQ